MLPCSCNINRYKMIWARFHNKGTNWKCSKLFQNWVKAAHVRYKSNLSHLYKQGQYADMRTREYFYYIDHQGQLFMDDAKVKNFITCFKDKAFLEFFFRRLRKNSTNRYQEYFPYISLCGRERNYIRCEDGPIVYAQVIDELEDQQVKYALSYGGVGAKLTVPFEPETLCMLPHSGRVYHKAPDKFGGVGLVKSSLAIELSSGFEFDGCGKIIKTEDGDFELPSKFIWNGIRYVLTNELLGKVASSFKFS